MSNVNEKESVVANESISRYECVDIPDSSSSFWNLRTDEYRRSVIDRVKAGYKSRTELEREWSELCRESFLFRALSWVLNVTMKAQNGILGYMSAHWVKPVFEPTVNQDIIGSFGPSPVTGSVSFLSKAAEKRFTEASPKEIAKFQSEKERLLALIGSEAELQKEKEELNRWFRQKYGAGAFSKTTSDKDE